jgi:serine protease
MRLIVSSLVLLAALTACLNPRFPPGIAGTVNAPIQFTAVPGYENVDFKPFEAIVRFTSPSGARTQSAEYDLASSITPSTVLLRQPAALRTQSVTDAKRGTLEWIARLRARGDVVFAEPNTVLKLQAVPSPNDPRLSAQWHYPQMNLPQAWAGFNAEADIGAGVIVAVLDSGILWDKDDATKRHPDFNCEVAPGVSKIAPGYDISRGDDNPLDDTLNTTGGAFSGYHGTHVAGTVGACTNNGVAGAGVTWRSRILPVRVFNGDSGSIADVARGIYWAVGATVPANVGGAALPVNPNPAQVLNLSLGAQQAPSAVLQEAVNEANARGAVVVVAAGNDGVDASRMTPANLQGVIVVGALGPQKERAPYSNFGPTVSVVAPGGNFTLRGAAADGVLSTLGCGVAGADNGDFGTPPGGKALPCVAGSEPGMGFMNGTSMATPHVAGIVALMMSRQPALLNPPSSAEKARNWARVLSLLRDASSLNGVTGCERGCGTGLLDADAAINRAINLPTLGSLVVQGSPLGAVDLGTTLSTATFTLKNIGDAAANLSMSVAGPNLSVTPSTAAIAPNASQTFTVNLNRAGLNGEYGARVIATEGSRSFAVRVYYQNGSNVVTNPGGYFIRIYKENGLDRERLNYPDTPLGANGSFEFPTLEPGVYDLTAYRQASVNPDGTIVADQLGERLGVVVDAEREITVVTLDNVQQTICSREGSREQGPTKCPGQ